MRFAIIATVQSLLIPAALACGYDGLIGDQFSAQHPKSLPVAFAINDAVAAGIIGSEAIAPIEVGQRGYWRAMNRLAHFAKLLGEGDSPAKRSDISILLIDSQLWTRLRAGPAGFEVEAHTRGPATDDAVIVTNQIVLEKIIEGDISASRALQIGIIAVDGERQTVAWLEGQMSRGVIPKKNPSEKTSAGKLVTPWGNKPGAFPQ